MISLVIFSKKNLNLSINLQKSSIHFGSVHKGRVKKFVVCMGEEKTNEERRLRGEGQTFPYK
jgi:hypothetical protein